MDESLHDWMAGMFDERDLDTWAAEMIEYVAIRNAIIESVLTYHRFTRQYPLNEEIVGERFAEMLGLISEIHRACDRLEELNARRSHDGSQQNNQPS